jgi:hypothetical protein
MEANGEPFSSTTQAAVAETPIAVAFNLALNGFSNSLCFAIRAVRQDFRKP